ncbi:iron ABC transporter permease [Paenibacillus anaericanus]|uniref:Iron ABC transporter permease n=1 Tax=Paenibacillus anaericanus TaxID=170367 RepID=A0A433Y8L9_9BACL|nr:iron ABC transporter permease [Paenibacillus anaericanus]RUT46212.1 iron ABC transporter permease [Paenibacillus anaericanus]
MLRTNRFLLTLFVIFLLTFGAFYLHITNGSFDMSIWDVIKTLLRIDPNPKHDLVIFEFRLPRIVIAMLVGIGLGIAGTVMQGVTRNGLADPGILGINAGAGASIVLFLLLFQMKAKHITDGSWTSTMMMPLFGFVGGALAAALILIFSRKNGRMDMQRLILTGISINSGFGALSMYISLKMNPQDFEMAAVWMVGSIYNANWIFVLSMLPWIVILSVIIYRKSHLLDYFQLEEGTVTSLGISVEKEKIILILCSVGLISACVSVSGSIGFIGLMAPHIARSLVGLRHRLIMPVSAGVGMFLLIISDYISKTVFEPSELPVGIVVSIIGIPYFLYLLVKSKA